MKYLHLDPAFAPYDGDVVLFEHFTFPGGEPHIKLKSSLTVGQAVTVTHRLNNFQDVGLLCVATDALRRMGARLQTLLLPYFPAARQDRLMVSGEPLTVKVYTDLINRLGFEQVLLIDAHSEVAPALLEHGVNIPNHYFIKNVLTKLSPTTLLVAPDGGALKKIYKLAAFLEGSYQVIECSKRRDVKTGGLTGFEVYAADLSGRDCLLVDDICDGGGTFIGLAQKLREHHAGRLYLAVTHGIFSQGLAALTTTFDHIFTTDSIKIHTHPQLTQIPIHTWLPSTP